MKAVGYQTPGALDRPEALIDIDLPMPAPGPQDLLVRVAAVSVNPVDTKVRKRATPAPGQWQVLGYDAVGTVTATGAAVQGFAPGDRVFYAGDITRPGANSEFHLVDARIAARAPQRLSDAETAALPLTAITAWEILFDRLEIARFVKKHGLTAFRMNPHFPVNTLKIMRGACAAQQLGVLAPYVDAVYAAMWEQQLNMADDAVIAEALQRAGLDAAALIATSQLPEVKERLLQNTQSAHERGAFGSPTFFVNGEIWFGKDRLREVEDEIVRLKA